MRIADMHCDTISRILEERESGRESLLLMNDGHIDLTRMKKSGYLVQNFALFVDGGRYTDKWERVCKLFRVYQSELSANSDMIAPVYCFKDIERNESAGKMSALLSVEEGGVCMGDLGKIKTLHDMGVRMMTFTWNYPNELGYPSTDASLGLTDKGREFACAMEETGIIPDVSHLSDRGFFDLLECTKKPFVASHSNARAVCGNARNMSDGMIRALSLRGGVMGINFCPDFLRKAPAPLSNDMDCFTAHAVHIISVGGIDVLALGSDFDGIDTNPSLPGAQSMYRLWDAFKKSGLKESELDKAFYKNVLRVYGDTIDY